MDRREHWQAVYEAKPADSVSWFQPVPAPSLAALDRLGVGPGASLIDIGGGASRLADALLERGWDVVTVLDIAESAIEVAKARLGPNADRVQWLAADIAAWPPNRAYDVWHDRAVLHFLIEEEQRVGYRRALEAGTKPGSHVVIATFAPDGPEQCSGLAVRRYDAGGLAAELGSGFRLIEDWREPHVTPWGASQSFQWAVFARV